MAVIIDGQKYYFPPGAKTPEKYQFVGDNYNIYGEQPGWIYNPWQDKYIPDPKAQKEFGEQQGLIEPEKAEPGLLSVLAPIAGTGLALTAGQSLGKEIPGLLGFGAEAAAETVPAVTGGLTSATGATGATSSLAGAAGGSAAVPVGTAANGGTLMSDGTILAGGGEFFSLGSEGLLGAGPMPLGNYLPGIAGAVGAYDLFSNKKHGTGGAAQGALSGAGIGFTLGGPVGAGIGAGVGALAGYFGNFGDVDAYKTEWKRKKELFDKGIISEAQLGPEPKSGRSKEELIAEAQATGGNVTFAGSRNESDLKAADIQGYATILEEAHKRGIPPLQLAEMALQSGAVREHHGTIDVEWGKVGAQAASPTAPQAPAAAPAAPAPQPAPATPQPSMQNFVGGTRIPSGLQNQQPEQPQPGLLSPNTRSMRMGMPSTTMPQVQMNRPALAPYKSPSPPQNPVPLTNQPLAPAPQAQPNAPAPQPVARPLAQQQPQYNKSGFVTMNPSGYDVDGDRRSISLLQPGLLSMRG